MIIAVFCLVLVLAINFGVARQIVLYVDLSTFFSVSGFVVAGCLLSIVVLAVISVTVTWIGTTNKGRRERTDQRRVALAKDEAAQAALDEAILQELNGHLTMLNRHASNSQVGSPMLSKSIEMSLSRIDAIPGLSDRHFANRGTTNQALFILAKLEQNGFKDIAMINRIKRTLGVEK